MLRLDYKKNLICVRQKILNLLKIHVKARLYGNILFSVYWNIILFQANELANRFYQNTGSAKLVLPLNDTELEKRYIIFPRLYLLKVSR